MRKHARLSLSPREQAFSFVADEDMHKHSKELKTVWWEDGTVRMINQRLLPHKHAIVICMSLEEVADAIRTMVIRGAPAIGCAGAYGMALVAHLATRTQAQEEPPAVTTTTLLDELRQSKQILDAQRPTAINLSWGTTRMLQRAEQLAQNTTSVDEMAQQLLNEAHSILAEDLAMCHAIGQHGAPLIPERGHVLTHCNAGGLATAGYGTALAPLRTATEQGRKVHVYVDETRPYLQGARLTTWELQQADIDQTLITDNMAGFLMRKGEIDCVIVGADRIAANGDVANKIGTYTLAVLAQVHRIPFYVAAPSSTIDLMCANGDTIPIEERSPQEVTQIEGVLIAPEGIAAAHPAFDVTPHELISAIVTEQGVIYPPFENDLRKHARRAAEA
jgi:methylthioribose-1-phosphate isomerase